MHPPSPSLSEGLGQQRPGARCPVLHPPAAASLAAAVLPRGPPAEGGVQRLQAAHPEVPVPSGGTAPAPWLSNEEGRCHLVPATPARHGHVDADGAPEGGAGLRGSTDLRESASHMVKKKKKKIGSLFKNRMQL